MASRLADRARCLMIEAPLLELRGELCSVDGVTTVIAGTLDRARRGARGACRQLAGRHVAQKIAIARRTSAARSCWRGRPACSSRIEKNVQHRPSREWIERKILDLFYDKSKVPPDCVDKAFEELSQRHGARS